MRKSPFPGAEEDHLGNPEDIHNLLAEQIGEGDTFPTGKNPSESSTDFPIGTIRDEDCSACKAKGCQIRKVPYGSTQPAPTAQEAVDRLRDDLRAAKVKVDLRLREANLTRHYMLGKDAELDALSGRLYKRMSKHFYRERGTRLSRIDELLTQVADPTEENRKLKADLAGKEEAMGYYKRAVQNPDAVEEFVKGVENLKLHLDKGIGKTQVKTPAGRISFPNMEKPDREPETKKFKVNFDLGKPFDSLREMESEIKKLAALDKKRKDAELDALSERLYARMSKHFYRERGARLSRIDELLYQVADLTEENRKLKTDLAGKVEVMDFYKRAVQNPDAVDWNTTGRRHDAAFIYVTGEEFETLKALKAGTASITLTPTPPPEHPWIDSETGKFIMPTLNKLFEVNDQHTGLQTLIRTSNGSNPIRFTYREGGVDVFLTSATGVVKPFGFKGSTWRYVV